MAKASLFGEQANRLARKKWNSVQELADELMAMFRATTPVELRAPLKVKNSSSTQPSLTIDQGSGNAKVKIKNADGSSGTLEATKKEGLKFTPDQPETPKFPAKKPAAAGGGGIPGKVISGSGSTYSVDIYENGNLTTASKRVTVTQLSIASGETIAAGTWVMVSKVKTAYFMQHPVWAASS